jgi:putative endonuclease
MGIYVYMLRCADDSFYIGSATGDDLQPRIDQHNTGAFPGYTFHRRPVVLVWSEHFDRIRDGIAAERQIKGWSRAKKRGVDPKRLDGDQPIVPPWWQVEAAVIAAILRGSPLCGERLRMTAEFVTAKS